MEVITERPDPGKRAVEARVVYVDVEGGCWALDTPNGRVQPLELASEFRVDGLAVAVRLRPMPDVATTCQVGPVVAIVSIVRR